MVFSLYNPHTSLPNENDDTKRLFNSNNLKKKKELSSINHVSYSKAFFRFVQKSKLWARSVNKRQSYLGKTKFHPTSPNWLQSCSGSQEKSLFPFWSKFQNMSKIGQQTPEICAFKRRPAFPANCTESLTLICCNPLFFKLIHPYFHE